MSELASASFEFYDGVRILLPGAVVAGLYEAVVRSFGLHAPLPSSDALAALTVVSIAGLALYYIDLPARSVLYYAGLPHKLLEEWGRPASKRTARNIYFVLMDTTMPSAIRSRAQYYNSMFRIGYEIVLLSCLAGPTVIACAYLTKSPGDTGDTSGTRTLLVIACALVALLATCAVTSGYLKAQDREKGIATPNRQRLSMLRSRLKRQIPIVDRVLLVVAAALSALYAAAGHHALLLAGACTIATLVWLFRYLRGVPDPKQVAPAEGGDGWPRRLSSAERRNLDASTSALVLAFTALLTWIPAAISLPHETHLTLGVALAWSAMTLGGASLMLFRGHETKLWGAYHTVATWMEDHKSEIVEAYEIVPTGSYTVPRRYRDARWWLPLSPGYGCFGAFNPHTSRPGSIPKPSAIFRRLCRLKLRWPRST